MKMNYKMRAVCAGTFVFTQILWADGVLTLTDGEYTNSAAYARADKIVVTGAAVLNFGKNITPTYSKEIAIQSGGRLSAKEAPRNIGKPSKLTVAAGGTLDISGEIVNGDYLLAKTELYIAGTGTNGKGAVWRGSGGGCNTIFGNITLTGNAKIGSQKTQCGCNEKKDINLNGHTLTWDGASDGGIFYLPYTQFKNNGSTDNPGHLVVTSGRLFFRYTALQGGSAANTITVASGAKIKLRDMTTQPKWKLIMGANAYLETDNADTSSGAAAKNVWAGPIETSGALVLSAESNPSYISATGGILGNHDIKGTGLGLVTVKGSNEVCKVLRPNGTGTLRFADSTNIISGPITFNFGTVAFTNSVVNLTYQTTGGFDICDTNSADGVAAVVFNDTVVQARIKENGAAYCRLYPGRNAGTFGTVTLNGAQVSNVSAVVGFSGVGGFYQHGGLFYWPLDLTNYDTPGSEATGYGYYRLDQGAKCVLDLDTGIGALGGNGVCVLDIQNGAKANCIGTKKNIIVSSGSGTSTIYAANGGAFTTEGSVMLSTETYAAAHAVNFAFTGTGSVFRVANGLQARSSNSLSRVNMSINDGAVFEAIGASRTEGAFAQGAAFYVNSNGGVFRPRRGAGDIFGGNGKYTIQTNTPTAVTVFEKGITIDTAVQKDKNYANLESGGTSAPLVAPPTNGLRVASIALPTDSGFAKEVYLGSPIVTITSTGNGRAATAFALYDETAKKVTNIVVTCAGWGYDAASTAITIDSGDRTKTYACTFTLEEQPVTGLGLRKTGAARFDLRDACTYRGPTEVLEGLLGFECTAADVAQGGLPVGSGLILHEGATVTVPYYYVPVTVPFIRGCGSTSYGYYTITEALEVNADEMLAGKYLKVKRTLILGANAVVRVRNPSALDAYHGTERFAIAEAGTLNVSGIPQVEFADGNYSGTRAQWAVRVDSVNKRLYLRRTTGLIISFR